ncbi:translation initiation factor IF-2 [Loxodonta africana]|uniref:translation initiation factor IF-2 n=1 Tax=Loxodonta africana TaxID=9785 RepID=UPI0030CAD286
MRPEDLEARIQKVKPAPHPPAHMWRYRSGHEWEGPTGGPVLVLSLGSLSGFGSQTAALSNPARPPGAWEASRPPRPDPRPGPRPTTARAQPSRGSRPPRRASRAPNPSEGCASPLPAASHGPEPASSPAQRAGDASPNIPRRASGLAGVAPRFDVPRPPLDHPEAASRPAPAPGPPHPGVAARPASPRRPPRGREDGAQRGARARAVPGWPRTLGGAAGSDCQGCKRQRDRSPRATLQIVAVSTPCPTALPTIRTFGACSPFFQPPSPPCLKGPAVRPPHPVPRRQAGSPSQAQETSAEVQAAEV